MLVFLLWENREINSKNSMAPAKMEKLIQRMPEICKAVIKAEGGYFVEKQVGKRRKVAKETVY